MTKSKKFLFIGFVIIVFIYVNASCSPTILLSTNETPIQKPSSTIIYPTPTEQKENSSSLVVKIEEMVIEVAKHRIYNDPTFTQKFDFGLRFSGFPPTSAPDFDSLFLVKNIVFFLVVNGQEIPLDLEQIGGGGGGPGLLEDGIISKSQDFTYKVINPLTPDKTYHIVTLVTLDYASSESDPIRFDFEIVPGATNIYTG